VELPCMGTCEMVCVTCGGGCPEGRAEPCGGLPGAAIPDTEKMMEPRSEKDICDTASMLLCDTTHVRWNAQHLKVLFSLGLTGLCIGRALQYEEHDANHLLIFIVRNALNDTATL